MQQRAERTRAQILRAAEEEFSELGFYGARVDSIATNAGVNKALIYKYYGNKEELYKTVFSLVYDRFTSLERKFVGDEESTDFREKVYRFVKLDFKYLEENPHYVRMLMWENMNHAKNFCESELGFSKVPILRGMEKIIEEARKEGNLSPSVDAKQLLLTFYACGFNYFSNMATLSNIVGTDLSSSQAKEKRIQSVADMIIAYLSPTTGRKMSGCTM